MLVAPIVFIVRQLGPTVQLVTQLELIHTFIRIHALPHVPQMLLLSTDKSVKIARITAQSVLRRQVNAQAVMIRSYFTATPA